MTSVDIVVLGAGSGGERTATLLAEAGRSVAVVERRLVGGECPFYACIPSKAMLMSASARAKLADAHGIGASSTSVDAGAADEAWERAVRRRDEIADHHDDTAHAEDLQTSGVTLIRGTGRIAGPGRVVVSRHDDSDVELTAEHLVLATGSAPVIPDIPGLADVDPWTYETAWATRSRPRSLLILGGGAVGCEIAQTFARFGTAVTVVDRSELGAGVLEPECADDLARVLADAGVEVRTGSGLEAVSRGSDGMVTAVVDGVEQQVEEVVVAVGMRPRLDGLGLQALGLDGDNLELDDRCRVQGVDPEVAGRVWAVGDVNGLAPFTHTANYEAQVVATNILGGDTVADHRAIPSAIYTSPSVAATGMTRKAATGQGAEIVSAVFDLRDTARMVVGDETAGRVVLVADRRSGRLLGACLVGPTAAESISEFSVAIRYGLTVHQMVDVVHPFPTWSEGFGPALQDLADQL